MKQPFLKVSQLSQSFNGHDVFKDFKFSLHEGDSILLQGENGSGKTTILKVLSGLLEPRSGVFKIENETAAAYKVVRHQLIAQSIYLHQQPFLFDTSVENNLAYAAKSQSALDEQDQRNLSRLFGIEQFLSKNAANLFYWAETNESLWQDR